MTRNISGTPGGRSHTDAVGGIDVGRRVRIGSGAILSPPIEIREEAFRNGDAVIETVAEL